MTRAWWSPPVLLGLLGAGCAGELSSDEPGTPPADEQAMVAVESPRAELAASPGEPEAAEPETAEAEAAEPERPYDPRWVDAVRQVVGTYSAWGRVDDEARWAPFLCRMPLPASARISESDDRGTHGEKLYTVYAMDPVAYGAEPSALRPGVSPELPELQQVIVKESFRPVPWDEAQDAKGVFFSDLRPAIRDGQRFVPGERQGLFIMMQTKGELPGTDAGWIYATVEPDLMTVSAVGAIVSCSGCHQQAGPGRLFGLPGFFRPTPSSANGAPRAQP